MTSPSRRIPYVPAVSGRLSTLLRLVLGLFALLLVDALYLSAVSILEHVTGRTYQSYFYQWMFLVHLVLGLLLLPAAVVFMGAHLRRARHRRNRRAVRAGIMLAGVSVVLLASGVALTRTLVPLHDPRARAALYWVHALSPLAVGWLFVLHRLAGPRIRWRVGLRWAAVGLAFAGAMVAFHSRHPKAWNEAGNAKGEKYFFPSLSRTVSAEFIPAELLASDRYCAECHADIHASWSSSAHRFSSFNNPAYLFSVKETRRVSYERDGNVTASRFCAGCHDPVPFLSGQFDDPRFDDPRYELARDPLATAGITCVVCHAITHVGNETGGTSVLGNGDYTIDAPVLYPFALSENRALRWVSNQLVKAKPDFHKATFLKPEIHRSAQFCGTCHKVHLPPELNGYKWLRGQNHYDSFWGSGVSGHNPASFYYPPKAQVGCNGCHMPLVATPSRDFGARPVEGEVAARLGAELAVHDHLFASANTGLAKLVGLPDDVVTKAQRFLEGALRLDLFGLRAGGTIDGALLAPLDPELPEVEPGGAYLLEVVLRTLRLGHLFTQGTADSNEVWVDVTASCGERVVARSGALDPLDGSVDPSAHFVNAFVLDREGRRIDRRNAQDIFVPLYDHQIPPGGADVVHYRFEVPERGCGALTLEAALQYRKFDTTFLRYVQGDTFTRNELPITTIARDRVTLPVRGRASAPPATATSVAAAASAPAPEPWERWNDYGIGLLRAGDGHGTLAQAEEAFQHVEALGRPDGPLNLARVHLASGRTLDAAPEALRRAAAFQPAPPPWTLLMLSGQVAMRNGDYAVAAAKLGQVAEGGFAAAAGRGFDFAQDPQLLGLLGTAHYQLALAAADPGERDARLWDAKQWFARALAQDSEDVRAHWGLGRIAQALGDPDGARRHEALHERYQNDDPARGAAVAAARVAYPAADRAASPVVVYDLGSPPGTHDLAAAGAAPAG